MKTPDEKPHKIMTPEEYAALNVKGWHRVCKDVDGAGNVGIQYEYPVARCQHGAALHMKCLKCNPY